MLYSACTDSNKFLLFIGLKVEICLTISVFICPQHLTETASRSAHKLQTTSDGNASVSNVAILFGSQKRRQPAVWLFLAPFP